jgi:predicted nucleic-acid-binding protein
MTITPDTNVLVRAAVRDDEDQMRAAARLLRDADVVAVPLPCLCEFVWVLDRVYRFSRQEIVIALERLVAAGNVVVDRPAVDAGLATLRAGGDFADGVIAHEGSWLGGETFVSFDKKAVAVLTKQGRRAKLLAH